MQEITDPLEHKLLKNKFCRQPWDTFGIKGSKSKHSVQVCCHDGTGAVGKMNWEDPMKAWNSPGAQELRSTILDGSFKKCIASPLSFSFLIFRTSEFDNLLNQHLWP